MAGKETVLAMKNPYVFRLTLLSPKGRRRSLERIVFSLTEWVDPSFQIINVEERLVDKRKNKSASLKQIGKLVSPALSVMLFMQENGNMCVKDVENILKKPPWTFHHKVELQNKNSPNFSLAKQEFYTLAKDLPLWAACPVATETEHLRVNLYVRNFKAMVEFYRAVTEVEIETHKPEFCIFQLYQQPGLDIQLSLKYSQYIYPVQTESAYFSFNVNSIETLKLGTQCDVSHINDNIYATRDPDGNLVVLYEQQKPHTNTSTLSTSLANSCTSTSTCACNIPTTSISGIELIDDVKSLKSSSDSQDSGRCSDLDGTLVDNVFSSETDLQTSDVLKKERIRTSEGYSSSGGSCNDTVPNTCVNKQDKSVEVPKGSKGKAPMRILPFFGKGKAKNKEIGSKQTEHTSESSRENIVPVYI